MLEIEKPKLECVELTDHYGKFVVEPLERGFGTNLAIPCVACCSRACPVWR